MKVKGSACGVVCLIDADLVHTSFVASGLIEMANAGDITLSFTSASRFVGRSARRGRFTTLFRVTDRHGSKWVCIDMHDGRAVLSLPSLELCDRYFKVNYERNITNESLSGASSVQAARVGPFVPYFACRPNKDRAVLRRLVGSVMAARAERRRLFRPLTLAGASQFYRASVGRLRRYKQRLHVREYETENQVVHDDRPRIVFFNPRFWPEGAHPQNALVNALRARIITRLKRELGDQFVGGFIPGAEVSRRHPELVFNRRLDHRDYVHLCKQSAVCIYTNGVGGCLSWKLGEYLAAGACIVGERLNAELMSPLDEGNGYLSFESPDECVDRVMSLRDDDRLRRRMRSGASTYYKTIASPRAALRRAIASVSMGHEDGPGWR